jgi:TPR repeat protein
MGLNEGTMMNVRLTNSRLVLFACLSFVVVLSGCDRSVDGEGRKTDHQAESPEQSTARINIDYSQYIDAYRRFSAIKEDAEKGDREAIFLMAEALFEGRGVEKDPEEALRLTRMAAAKGHPLALLQMSELYNAAYLVGNGDNFLFYMLVTPDQEKAREYRLKSVDAIRADIEANNFDPRVVAGYASRLEQGDDEFVEEDLDEALRLYELAIGELTARANAGHYPSMLLLSEIYREGYLMRMRSAETSDNWLQKALATEHPAVKHFKAELIEDSDPALAEQLLSEAANDGWEPAMIALGSEKKYEEAIPLWIRAYEQRESSSIAYSIALAYSSKGDHDRAFSWFVKNFNSGDVYSVKGAFQGALVELERMSGNDFTQMKETENFQMLGRYLRSLVGLCQRLENTAFKGREELCGLSVYLPMFEQ